MPNRPLLVGSLATLALFSAAPAFAQTPQRVCAVRVGDGSAALSNASTATFLDCFSLAGAPNGTTALPIAESASGAPLTLSGSATSEGSLRLSSNGRYLTLAGYGAAPGMASVVAAPSATVNRVVARIDAQGVVDTTTRTDAAYSANNIRGVVSDDGTRFWTTGTAATNGGVQHVSFGAGSVWTQIATTPTNTRVPGIFAGQLFITSASGAFVGVTSVGAGLPTPPPPHTATLLSGFPGSGSPSPYGFVAFDLNAGVTGVDTLYVADDRNVTSGGGIQKWLLGVSGGTWTLASTFAAPGTSGARGLTAYRLSGTTVALYATTAEAVANRLVTLTDDGTPAPAVTVLATAAANTVYRGVDFGPVAAAAVPASNGPGRLVLLMLLGAMGVFALRPRRSRV